MLRRLICATGAAVAAAVLPMAPASAQTPAIPNTVWAEMNCIFDSLNADQLNMLVDNYFDPIDEEVKVVDAVFDRAHSVCGDRHKWSEEQHDLADEIAVMAAVIDAVAMLLEDSGVKNIDSLVMLHETLTDAERQAFRGDGWFDDRAFVGRMKAHLRAAGVPDNPDLLELSLAMLEAGCMADHAITGFMATKGYIIPPPGQRERS